MPAYRVCISFKKNQVLNLLKFCFKFMYIVVCIPVVLELFAMIINHVYDKSQAMEVWLESKREKN